MARKIANTNENIDRSLATLNAILSNPILFDEIKAEARIKNISIYDATAKVAVNYITALGRKLENSK